MVVPAASLASAISELLGSIDPLGKASAYYDPNPDGPDGCVLAEGRWQVLRAGRSFELIATDDTSTMHSTLTSVVANMLMADAIVMMAEAERRVNPAPAQVARVTVNGRKGSSVYAEWPADEASLTEVLNAALIRAQDLVAAGTPRGDVTVRMHLA